MGFMGGSCAIFQLVVLYGSQDLRKHPSQMLLVWHMDLYLEHVNLQVKIPLL